MTNSAIKALVKCDPVLADLIPRTELPDLPESRGGWYDLVSCLVDQAVPARSRGVYMRKLVALLGGEDPDPNNVYTIEEEDWVATKMARAKYHALLGFADWWNERKMEDHHFRELTDQEIRDQLLPLKGIGPQTVDMLLLFTLGRPDVFPVGDYHLKQIMEVLYLKEDEKLKASMLTAAEKWVPYRSLATRYLLAYKAQCTRA